MDRRQVAPLLVEIHAVAEHVGIRHLHADMVGADAFDATVVDLFREHGDPHLGRALVFAPVLHRQQGMAFVEDVVGQQHLAPAHRRGRAMQPRKPRSAGLAAIAGGVQVIEFEVEPALAQRERELRGERQAAVHHRDVQRHLAFGIGISDLAGDAFDRRLQRRAVVHDMRIGQCIGELGRAHVAFAASLAPEVAPASVANTGTVSIAACAAW